MKRKPYSVTFPERETRGALSLVVSRIAHPFQRGDDPKLLMMTDRQAANLRQDGWGVVSAFATGDELVYGDGGVASVSNPVVAVEIETEPKPRRSRRREE